MAQARLAQENQLQADLTALRAVQQQTDADAERQRTLLSQEYASAIRQAQAENDLAKAQALYERAALEEERLHQKQLAAEQAQAASQQAALEQQLAAAKFVAQETGDYSMYGALLGWSSDYIDKLNGEITSPLVDKDSSPGVIMTDTGPVKNNIEYYRNPLGLVGAEGYAAAVRGNAAETGAIQEAIRNGTGFTGSTYQDAANYLSILGVKTDQLLSKSDWLRAKKDGVPMAAVTGYTTYEDYLRGYVAYMEAKKKGQIT
jgi:multidrug efflux pump subunit AcrA (membrane-fusion protein)